MPVDIVLLQPESPGNIGSVARAMKNFSFTNLVLVKPCPVTDETKGFAMHAWDLVKRARLLKNMDWSYDLVVGTTGLEGNKSLRSYLTPQQLSSRIGKGRTAIVFGRESKGLSNKELERCDCVCKIPTSQEYPVMNLSHAVALVLYELNRAGKKRKETALREQTSTLQNLFIEVIEKLNYSERKTKLVNACLRNVVARSIPSKNEASVLTGLFKKIKKRCV